MRADLGFPKMPTDNGQMLFFAFAAAIVLFQIFKGWRLGLVRQIVRFSALAAAYIAAIWGGAMTVPFLRPLGYPDLLLRLAGGAGLGLGVYLVICIFGGILFKRTAHQDVALVWFFYGATGALMGALFGLVLTVAAADAVRLLGSLAQASNPKTRTMFNAGLVNWMRSIESGSVGEVLRTVDPVPRRVYAIAGKVGQTAADPEAAARFLAFSGAAEMARQPEIQALRDDPEIAAALKDRCYLALLKNPKVVRAANSPEVAAQFRQFDLEKALDKALAKERDR